MSRYVTEHYSNRREYLDWLAKVYGVERADVILLSSILGTDQDFDGLPHALEGFAAEARPETQPSSKSNLKTRELFKMKHQKEESANGRSQEKPLDRSVPRPSPRRTSGDTRAARGGKTACR